MGNRKKVFEDDDNDLKMDFWKPDFGIDVAFNHRSFIGGDLLRLQAAAEVKDLIKVGIYICATKDFAKYLSPKDASSMVSFERAKWVSGKLLPVITTPIYLVGLSKSTDAQPPPSTGRPASYAGRFFPPFGLRSPVTSNVRRHNLPNAPLRALPRIFATGVSSLDR